MSEELNAILLTLHNIKWKLDGLESQILKAMNQDKPKEQ